MDPRARSRDRSVCTKRGPRRVEKLSSRDEGEETADRLLDQLPIRNRLSYRLYTGSGDLAPFSGIGGTSQGLLMFTISPVDRCSVSRMEEQQRGNGREKQRGQPTLSVTRRRAAEIHEERYCRRHRPTHRLERASNSCGDYAGLSR
jgi:hypothetical protein